MSKSKGNVIDPLDIVDGICLEALAGQTHLRPHAAADGGGYRKGTRQQFPQGSQPTAPMRCACASHVSLRKPATCDSTWPSVEEYRNFCNKLWNASRYVLMNVEGQDHRGAGRRVQPGRSLDQSRLAAMLGAHRRDSPIIASISSPTLCTISPGMSSATGIWNYPRRSAIDRPRRRQSAARALP